MRAVWAKGRRDNQRGATCAKDLRAGVTLGVLIPGAERPQVCSKEEHRP
jgi:hypothetical protein